MEKIIYSHKNEVINQFLDNSVNKQNDDFHNLHYMLHSSEVFRLPDNAVLPVIQKYSDYYDFMKSPYTYYLLEYCLDGVWVMLFVFDSRLNPDDNVFRPDNSLECKVISRNNFNSVWSIDAEFTFYLLENGFKFKPFKSDYPPEYHESLVILIVRFLVCINTPNIKQVEVKPPKYVNAKRLKKGKALLSGYKFLDLSPSRKDLSLVDSAGGTGTSKRMHWRRGHIRRLEDHTVWVRPALIGSGNFVDKTYRVYGQ